MQGKLTLICAPAGFGKTSLLSEWCASLAADVYAVAWVSLENLDNESSRFWRYVFTALEQAFPGSGAEALRLLQTTESPALEVILTRFINVMLTSSHRVELVLDDYHALTATTTVQQELSLLLKHLPPQLHITLASRSNPPLALARLRAKGQLTEIRSEDLRFTHQETMALLQKVEGLALTAEDAAVLEERTEGWIAGLHLAILSLQRRTDYVSFISALTGTDRYILDYLTEEVLQQQSESIRTFLLRTSLLERLNGSLCDVVTGQRNSQALLEQIEQANLFLIPLDSERIWYRYHPLLKDVLFRQLQHSEPDLILELHRRAATWYEHNGPMSQAIGHALDATNYDRAAQLIEQVAGPMLLRGERQTLRHWLESLPMAYFRQRPYLCVTYATLLIWFYKFEHAESYLALAESRLHNDYVGDAQAQTQKLLSEIDSIRARIARLQGDTSHAIALSQQASERLPREDTSLQASINLNLAVGYLFRGEVEACLQASRSVQELSQAEGNLYGVEQALTCLAMIQTFQGQLNEAYTTCQDGLNMVEKSVDRKQEPKMSAGLLQVVMGMVLYEWNDLEEAAQYLLKGIAGCERSGETGTLASAYTALARLRQAQGAEDEAVELMRQAEQLLQTQMAMLAPYTAIIVSHLIRLWLAQGKLEQAKLYMKERQPQLDQALHLLREKEYLSQVRVLIAESRIGKKSHIERLLTRAMGIAEQVRHAAGKGGRIEHVIEALLLEALILQEQEDLSHALAKLNPAFTLALPGGYIRIFVDEGEAMVALLRRVDTIGPLETYVNALRAAVGMQRNLPQDTIRLSSPSPLYSSSSPPLLEPLSEREVEVLHLMAAGYSNSEIARTLYLSTGTVKTHLKHIYGKLDVHTRTQAIVRARQIYLLPS
jgi:LuxR family transcriptional regulator, maltose regulon positive regulatory protein